MNHASLFSGIGGFDLAAEWMDWNNILHCEINPFCRQILNYYWPNAISYSDIRKLDGKKYRGQIDVLSGGFPCQPFSHAGKRKGSGDDRFLWPEYLRIIREVRPRWVTGENVPGILTIEKGVVFESICTDLEKEGYTVWTFNIPAAGVEAPHRRERIWIVAYNKSNQQRKQSIGGLRLESGIFSDGVYSSRFADSINPGLQGNQQRRAFEQRERTPRPTPERFENESWFEAATRLCVVDDGLSGKLDGITLSKWRTESLKAAGNAVVPEIPYQIFQAIQEYEQQ